MKRGTFRFFISICFLILIICPIFAQNAAELEVRKTQIENALRTSHKILDSHIKKRKSRAAKLIGLKRQIEDRNKLRQTLDAQVRLYQDSLTKYEAELNLFKKHLKRINHEYTELCQRHFIEKKLNTPSLLLFSSKNLEDAFKKWLFWNQYQDIRKTQLKSLVQTVHQLEWMRLNYQELFLKNQQILESQLKTNAQLEKDLIKQDQLIQKLEKDEQKLKNNIVEKEKEFHLLNKQIEKAIAEDRKRKLEKSSTPIISRENLKFTDEKGALPSPVDQGYIIRDYGVQAHPNLKGVNIKNNGIDIATSNNADVKPIADGEVRGIMQISGYKNVILVSHGEFYSLYGNLVGIMVGKGDQVNRSTTLGKAALHSEFEEFTVHLELWHGKDKQDPKNWIQLNE